MYYGYSRRYTPGSFGRGGQKILSALSYIGIMWIVSLIFGRYDDKVRFHINQGIILTIFEFIFRLILFILHAAVNIFLIIPFSIVPLLSVPGVIINKALTFIYWGLMSVFILIGVVNALAGRQKPLPIIGKFSVLK